MQHRLGALAVISTLFTGSALAEQETKTSSDKSDLSVMVFAGSAVRGFDSYPFKSTYGAQKQAGVSAAWTPKALPFGFLAGIDGGAVLRSDEDRFGPSGESVEVWLGPTLRHKGLSLGPVRVRPAVTVGLSAVSDSYGLERAREIEDDGDAALLYYIAPEIAFSLKSAPNIDLVYRLQHRSGAEQVDNIPTIGSMGDTTNANTIGIRYHF